MMMDETDLVFARPHFDSEGTITSKFPPEDKEGTARVNFKCLRITLKDFVSTDHNMVKPGK